MRRYLRIYRECVRVSLAMASAYRTNFVLSGIILLVSNILLPLVTILIYRSGASFPGWSVFQVLLIQSIFAMANGIASMCFNNVLWVTMRHVQYGDLEVVLIRPLNLLFYLMASTFDIDSFPLLLGGLVMFIVSLTQIGTLSAMGWIGFIILFLAGILVMFGIALLMASTAFKWVANSRIPEIFNSIQMFGKYPMGVFPSWIRGVCSFLMPVAMIGFFPASALLGTVEWWMFLAVLPCILFAIAGIALFRKMVKLYEGVGG